MKRLLGSLATQLLVLLLMALVCAHLLAAVVMAWGEGVRVHPLSVRTITTQVMAAYQLARTNADTALEILNVAESRFTRLARAPDVALAPQHQEPTLIASMRQSLDLPAGVPVHAALRSLPSEAVDIPTNAPPWLVQALAADRVWALDVALPLPDGQWLHSQHWPTMMHPHWDRVLRFSFIMSLLACMLIAVLFGRSIMRPLKALAHAARHISRGETMPSLPLQGPRGVREITQAFNDMQERLRRFVADRTQMIAAIGHDLRTPLTSLRIRTEMIQDASLRSAMCATLDEMALMAQESLRFAQDDATQELTQSVDIVALIDEVVTHHGMLGQDVQWQAPCPIAYRCRPSHLKRVLSNLIDNATRYGHVWVQVFTDNTQLRITVEDDGPGIAPDQLEYVFEPFARLDAARHLEGGSAGLGLSIARSFTRAHGGDVHLEHRAEGGLRAVVTLPL